MTKLNSIVALLLACSFLVGCGGGDTETKKKSSNADSSSTSSSSDQRSGGVSGSNGKNSEAPNKEPEIQLEVAKLSIKDLIDQFEKDQDKLRNKLLEVTGRVFKIGLQKEEGETMYQVMLVNVKDPEKEFDILNADTDTLLNCYVSAKSDLLNCNYGEEVTMRGKLADRRYLIECTLEGSDNKPIPSMTVSELAKQFKADPKALEAKYKNSYIAVKGKVARNDVEEHVGYYDVKTVLVADDKTEIGLHRPGYDMVFQYDGVKPGDVINVVGKFLPGNDDEESLPLGIEFATRVDGE